MLVVLVVLVDLQGSCLREGELRARSLEVEGQLNHQVMEVGVGVGVGHQNSVVAGQQVHLISEVELVIISLVLVSMLGIRLLLMLPLLLSPLDQ